ncbi:MAG: hypothetical protein COU31_03765 [Candidatus Magasanikbacteria bacterium CG10_big_fil_rev_8_21_14_0_10_40_10]|uniref:Uncharacterized protein n=1 Tax=Candidatus Magasanikbacteria bacterium CG10_big_fil_rev_8_21_14_0_10_40_10 TaxID=1974648 RepID=A0A2M6W3C1_9BACT|nr:MAG: hypothetical protein COU31_03765 [Candidatus Magasanikbacteria bacterium CG10_big_fil_rev_8_21_14_0_10_40_10]
MKEGTLSAIYNSRSKTFLSLCLCFVGGITWASAFDIGRRGLLVIYGLLLASGLLVALAWIIKRKLIFIHGKLLASLPFLGLCLFFFSLGLWRYALSKPLLNRQHIAYFAGANKTFDAQVVAEADVRLGYVNYIVQPVEYYGRVLVKQPLYPRYSVGRYLSVKCWLQNQINTDSDFNYIKYLARQRVYATCSFAQINEITAGRLEKKQTAKIVFFHWIFGLKDKVAERINLLWSEPQSSFMAGLLYGSRAGLPAQLSEAFNRAGLTHIIAISGYNISLITIGLMSVMTTVGLHRRRAFWLCLAVVIVFVIFTGASASVVRAGLMGILVLIGQYLGRLSRIFNTMILVLVVMLAVNPMVLFWDVGFQLSFLATFGLVYISPFIVDWLGFVKINWLIQMLGATLSAIIATLPLIMFQFGRLSLVAPLSNLLVLWIIPFLMLIGFLALLISCFSLPAGLILSALAQIGLNYVIIIATYLAGFSWSAVDIKISLGLMIGLYILLFFAIVRKLK